MLIAPRIACLAVLVLAAPVLAPGRTLAQTAPSPTLAHHAHHRRALLHRPAGIQPLPPAPTPVASNTSPAPVPNESVTAPHADAPKQESQVSPSVFQLHYPPQGDGYVTGSSPQALDDRNAAKATGVQATVPLSQ